MPYLQDLLYRIQMPQEATDILLSTASQFKPADLANASDAFFSGSDLHDEIGIMANQAGVPYETATLCVLLLLSERTKEDYKSAGWPENLFYDTMDDYTVWARTGLRACGYWGIPRDKAWWTCKHLRMELIRLGRLQFEPSTFQMDTYHGRTVDLQRGDPVLNCHIPEGEPFTKVRRYDSYSRAVEFFGSNLFAVESWLLYPVHRQILKPSSNIIGFMDDFTTIHTEVWHDGRDLWRIFGFLDCYDPQTLPKKTSVQQAYAAHLQKTGETGGGYGIMLFENGQCTRP
jgi:hypothetical protein